MRERRRCHDTPEFSDAELVAISITRDDFHRDWNYTTGAHGTRWNTTNRTSVFDRCLGTREHTRDLVGPSACEWHGERVRADTTPSADATGFSTLALSCGSTTAAASERFHPEGRREA